jgi:hypothetical protein
MEYSLHNRFLDVRKHGHVRFGSGPGYEMKITLKDGGFSLCEEQTCPLT